MPRQGSAAGGIALSGWCGSRRALVAGARVPARCAAGLALAIGLCAAVASAGQIQFEPDWSAVTAPFYPLAPDGAVQPVFTAAAVTDTTAFFVADPFLIHTGGIWYLFFEVTVPRAEIGYATSLDGLTWQYQHVIVREKWDISFPDVFEADGVYYMTPESAANQTVRLYRANTFPGSWSRAAVLLSGRPFADPAVFRYGGLWWMFVGNGASDTCWLYYSSTLDHGWTEHPASPIVVADRGRARPAGRAVVLAGDQLFRTAQNCTPTYGHGVRVFQVDELTPTTYHEHEVAESPILEASGTGWNADGMHQCDPVWVGDHWETSVDGIAGSHWSIGIYRSPSVPASALPGNDRLPFMRCAPNPFRTATRIELMVPLRVPRTASSLAAMSPAAVAPAATLAIYDPAGRLVLARGLPLPLTGFATFDWDGTDATGRSLPAGVYLCRVRLEDRDTTSRLVRLR